MIKKWLSLQSTYDGLGKVLPWLGLMSGLFLVFGLVGGLWLAPADYQQGNAFRIIYVHVPSAFWSLGVYSVMFACSIVYLLWRVKLADIVASASASLGATFTLIALVTGAFWGKPMWGTWWIWDARLTSELILFFLYLGYLGLRSAISDQHRSAKAGAVLALLGMIDVPIIHFSVEWWATLHQGPSLSRFARPSIANEMLYPLLAMIVGFGLFYGTVLAVRVRTLILMREQRTLWVKNWLLARSAL